jgi:hypothetical protein
VVGQLCSSSRFRDKALQALNLTFILDVKELLLVVSNSQPVRMEEEAVYMLSFKDVTQRLHTSS